MLCVSLCATFFFFPIGTGPVSITSLLLLAIWLFSGRIFTDYSKLAAQPWALPVVLITVMQIISLAWSQDTAEGLKWLHKTHYLLFSFAVYSTLTATNCYYKIVWAFICGICVNVIFSMLQFVNLIKWIHPIQLSYGLMGYITYTLLVVAGMLLLSFIYRETASNKRRLVLLLMMGAFLFNIVILRGRMGYITLFVALPIMFLNIFGRQYLIRVLIFSSISIALILSSPTIRARLAIIPKEIITYSDTKPEESMGSIEIRLHMWRGASKIFMEHPILGAGLGGFKKALDKHNNAIDKLMYAHPHNSYLYIAACFGSIGLLLYGWLISLLVRDGWRRRYTIGGYIVLSFLLVILVGSLSDTQIFSNATGIIFGMLPGFLQPKHCGMMDNNGFRTI
jgi:O-antigen ligase